MTSRSRIIVTLALIGVAPAVLSAEATFSEWATAWDGSEERSELVERNLATVAVAGDGPWVVYQKLRNQIEELDVNGEEAHWRNQMLCHMDEAGTDSRVYVDALDATQVWPTRSDQEQLTLETVERIKQAAPTLSALNAGRFRPDPANPRTGKYQLFSGTNSECGTIAIPSEWDRMGARVLWTTADLLEQLMMMERDPKVEAMAREIERSDAKWDAFFKNVVYDGFPWELAINEMLKSPLQSLRGTLAQPPSAQVRFLHPTPVMAIASEDETTFKANLVIEALGWRNYDTTSYEPRWGVSVIAALRESRDESNGYGILLTFRGWSLGAVQRDTAENDNEIQVIVGVDVARWIQAAREKAGANLDRFDELRERLSEGWSEAREHVRAPTAGP